MESSLVYTDSIEEKSKYLYDKFKEDKFDKSKYFDLIKMYQNLTNKKIDVVFIEVPTNRLSNYFNSSFLGDYENLINKLDEHVNLIKLDSAKFQQSNYRNLDHMNSSGALIVTNEIIDLLQKTH
jgi:poly-D-alanine transfer protein DltD